MTGILPLFPVAIVTGIVARRQIAGSGGRLRGRGAATAGLVLGILWAIAVAAVAVLLVVGVFSTDDEGSNAERFSGEQAEVATVIDQVQDALDANDGERLCNDLLSPSFEASVTAAEGSCESFVSQLMPGGAQPELDVKDITIDRAIATVRLTEDQTPQVWQLERSGGSWRVDAINASPTSGAAGTD